MKFMKLGSRPDTFFTTEAVRSIASEVSSDLIIQVKGSRYLLHKFPLLSKCQRLQQLCAESPDPSSSPQIVQLPEFPGGAEAFELCAKFCYGITITLSAYNVVAARCAAEYLGMGEDVERGNLAGKIDVFLSSCVLGGWRDSVVALQSTKRFSLWAEQLGITARCVEAVVAKVLANPAKVSLAHSHSRRGRDDAVSCDGSYSQRQSRGWWADDLAELEIELFWRVMVAIKSGRIAPSLVGDALKIYAARSLPGIPRNGFSVNEGESDCTKHRLLLESIVSLIPSEKGSVSCSFLLQLLKASNILCASAASRAELTKRVAIQLEEASVTDLLIPCRVGASDKKAGFVKYDIDVVLSILEQFMLQGLQSPPTSPPRSRLRPERRRRSRSAENVDFGFQESRRSSSASHGSKIRVAKIVDGYLQEIATEGNLSLGKFIAVAEAVPEFARIDHDDLYGAIDIYLKAHPELNKSERKRLCRILDCKKLSMEACMHAAQNELLPLRVVVQVLFFEQARATTMGSTKGCKMAELPSNIRALLAAHGIDPSKPPPPLSSVTAADDQWSVSGLKSPNSQKIPTLRMKLAEDDALDQSEIKSSRLKALCSIPTRPKRMLSKFWSANRTPS